MTAPSSCSTSFPAVLPETPGKTISLISTICIPIAYVLMLAYFRWNQNTSLYLRKRSFPLYVASVAAAMLTWAMTSLYDTIGAQAFPCWLYMLINYLATPTFVLPSMIVVLRYTSEVSALRLQHALARSKNGGGDDEPPSTSVDASSQQGVAPTRLKKMVQITAELSWDGFWAHIRVVFFGSRSEKDRILNARFSRSFLVIIFWSNIVLLPYPVAYIVRLATNPQWLTCSGCEIEPFDAYFIMLETVVAFVLGASAHTLRIRRRDALRLVRESMYVWGVGAIFSVFSYSLFLADPGQIYAQGLYNWRSGLNLCCLLGVYIHTVHQVFVARAIRTKLLQLPSFNRAERFDEVMRDKDLKQQLRNFLDAELSPEILLFLESVDEYRLHYDREGTQRRARTILDTFIQYRAPMEINISSPLRFRLIAELTRGNVDVKVFDQAYTEVRDNLLLDGFARFLQKLAKEQPELNSSFSAPSRKTLAKIGSMTPSMPVSRSLSLTPKVDIADDVEAGGRS